MIKYDDRDKILSISTLSELHDLISERYEAGYKRGERMNEWVIRGKWFLDTCGNCSTISDVCKSTDDNFVYNSKREPLLQSLSDYSSKGYNWTGYYNYPAPADKRCPHCRSYWALADADDVVRDTQVEVVSLEAHIGRTLQEVRSIFEEPDDAVYSMQKDICIRNDRWINTDQVEGYKSLQVNPRGWSAANRAGDKWPIIDYDSYIIQPGDEAHFNVSRYYHPDCKLQLLEDTHKIRFKEVFEASGMTVRRMSAVKNEYGSLEYRGPWWEVYTNIGLVKVGWRKRVIEMDYSSIIEKDLFPEEENTKSSGMIHADNYDHLKKLLTKLLKVSKRWS